MAASLSWGPLAAAALLVSAGLAGCGGGVGDPADCVPGNASATDLQVYFGCGCFWHVQYEFVTLEQGELSRQGAAITARAGYAGGTSVGAGCLVCYHNLGSVADYDQLGHTEVVGLTLPEDKFEAAANRFWEVCPSGNRRDPQDRGGQYRSAVGLPGGMSSPLLPTLQSGGGGVQLVAGVGDEGDDYNTGRVYVYDTATFPFHVAEKYHQFHDDMMDRYPGEYHELAEHAEATDCPVLSGELLA